MSTTHSPPIVRFRGVSKAYGTFVAIRDLDLDIARGEFLTFLGPSGSGKTTTLMLLTGFEMASGGAIELDGQRIEARPAHKRDIGVVFQNYALFPHMSAAENIAFPLKVRGMGRAQVEEEVKRALAMMHLADKGDRKPGQLSGGQQQRVALARAIVFKPRLIVLDEPLGALDKNLREQMQDELKALHRQIGITMVFVTHDQSEALTLSDRVAVFKQGRIEQLDTPERLYRLPATAFVAGFIGENNLVSGKVEHIGDGDISVRVGAGGLLHAKPAGGLRHGDAAVVAIRPEHISLLRAGSPDGMPARVVQTTYLGDSYRVDVNADGIGVLKVKVSGSATVEIPEAGALIGIRVAEKSCRALPADSSK
ncbi:spermidine/putrescine ABC transporter ATP-binding protein (plasmid) [Rhizobium etli]|uniref:Spermidine/putrescine ABC transporter ATP-binding protein n=1 Tax=Rhizobium etli TaxID=29449 RepID=A0AAN1BND5_RHIET|nr:ABC transporter ATP-binding protein [Rhizobium etli]ARQ14419.1 spermidine/putrescine ABC transporter ATP-binding protein [Rhizobium etli]